MFYDLQWFRIPWVETNVNNIPLSIVIRYFVILRRFWLESKTFEWLNQILILKGKTYFPILLKKVFNVKCFLQKCQSTIRIHLDWFCTLEAHLKHSYGFIFRAWGHSKNKWQFFSTFSTSFSTRPRVWHYYIFK